jgi:hypothetical protein
MAKAEATVEELVSMIQRGQLRLSLVPPGAHHRLQFHHIFPKARLKKGFTSREADDIANLAFMGGKINRAISDKPPATYLSPLVAQHGSQIFEAPGIPLERNLSDVPNYKAFLAQCRKLIAARLNEFLAPQISQRITY